MIENSEVMKTILEAIGSPKAKESKDGKAITFSGKAADGITGNLSLRPSKSTGMAWDFKFNNEHLNKHIDKPIIDVEKVFADQKKLEERVALQKINDNIAKINTKANKPRTNIMEFIRENPEYVSSVINSSSKTNPDSLGFGSDSSENHAQPDYSHIDRYGSVDNTPGPDLSEKPIIDKVVRNMNNLIIRKGDANYPKGG